MVLIVLTVMKKFICFIYSFLTIEMVDASIGDSVLAKWRDLFIPAVINTVEQNSVEVKLLKSNKSLIYSISSKSSLKENLKECEDEISQGEISIVSNFSPTKNQLKIGTAVCVLSSRSNFYHHGFIDSISRLEMQKLFTVALTHPLHLLDQSSATTHLQSNIDSLRLLQGIRASHCMLGFVYNFDTTSFKNPSPLDMHMLETQPILNMEAYPYQCVKSEERKTICSTYGPAQILGALPWSKYNIPANDTVPPISHSTNIDSYTTAKRGGPIKPPKNEGYKKGTIRVSPMGIKQKFNGKMWRRTCRIEECHKESQRNGLCARHAYFSVTNLMSREIYNSVKYNLSMAMNSDPPNVGQLVRFGEKEDRITQSHGGVLTMSKMHLSAYVPLMEDTGQEEHQRGPDGGSETNICG